MVQKGNTTTQYWKYQLIGWGLASLYWAYIFYFKQEYSIFYTIFNFFFDVLIGVSLTHGYSLFLKKTNYKPSNKFNIIQLIIPVIILAVLFMLLNNLKWSLHFVFVKNGTINIIESLFFWDPPLITGLRLMSIWVLAYHLHHYYKAQIITTKHNAELSISAKQEQLNHLSKQLKPHFLFNSLNSIKSLIAENPKKARRSVDLLSDLLRSSIYTKAPLITIAEELQLINDYIELEKIRFEDRLNLKLAIDENLLNYKIPALSIQTLIENGVKHGIQNSLKGGTILLSISQKEKAIEIEVRNPGKLIHEDQEDKGLGLKNLSKRLRLQYNEKASFTLNEQPQGLIVAKLIIPIQTDQ